MLLWIDLETTGLEPQDDQILEVAWQLTDDSLVPVDDMHTHVIEPTPHTWKILPLEPVVWQMHEESGLLHDLEKSQHLMQLCDVEDLILRQIENVDEQIMVAGFSVHFDLGFIREHMPRLARKLSHRIYDVTTLKTFFKSFNVVASYENVGKHRAYWDTLEAMSIARDFRNFVHTHTESEPVGDIPGFEGFMNALNSLTIRGENNA